MSTDIRIEVGFLDHPKTVKLERRLGLEGLKALLRLWLWSARYRPSGDLRGMSEEDIAIAAGWQGDEGVLCKTLCELGWLDQSEEGYSLHEWCLHNPWAADSTTRSDKARLSRLAALHPGRYQMLLRAGYSGISASEYRSVIDGTHSALRSYPPCVQCTEGLVDESLTVVERAGTTPFSPAPAPVPFPTPAHKKDSRLSTELSTEYSTKDFHSAVTEAMFAFRRLLPPEIAPTNGDREWLEKLTADYGVLVPTELLKIRKWIEKKRIAGEIKDLRGFILAWLKKAQSETMDSKTVR